MPAASGCCSSEVRLRAKFDRVGELVVLHGQHRSLQGRPVRGALEQVQGAEVATDEPAADLARIHRPPTLAGLDLSLVLVGEPQVVGPGGRGSDVERLVAQTGLPEPAPGVLEVVAHPEGRPVRAGVGHQPGAGQDGVLQRRDVGVAAEDLGVAGDQVPVQVRQQLVAVEAADHGQDPLHRRIGEGGMKVIDARGDGRGVEVVPLVDVVAEGERQPHLGEPVRDQPGMVVLHHQGTTPRGGDDPDRVPGTELRRIDRWRRHAGHPTAPTFAASRRTTGVGSRPPTLVSRLDARNVGRAAEDGAPQSPTRSPRLTAAAPGRRAATRHCPGCAGRYTARGRRPRARDPRRGPGPRGR